MSDVDRWFRRTYQKRNYQTTKWHLIASEEGDSLVTKCKRRMKRDTGNAGGQRLEITDSRPTDYVGTFTTVCFNCLDRENR